jgi:hypothetical protein
LYNEAHTAQKSMQHVHSVAQHALSFLVPRSERPPRGSPRIAHLITPLWHDGRGQPVSTPSRLKKSWRSASFDSLEPPLTRECGSAVPTFRTTCWNCISLSLAHRSRLSRCECLGGLFLPCLCKLAVTALAVMEPLVKSPFKDSTLPRPHCEYEVVG